MDKNEEISIELQKRFEFYLLAIVFTILGLSIQTSKLSTCTQGVIEISAWISFLVSGLAGLSRMEWRPVLYLHHSKIKKEKSYSRDASAGRTILHDSGKPMSRQEAAEFISQLNEKIDDREKVIKRIDSRSNVKYLLHKWLFVIGLVLLIISRAMGFFS